MIVADTNLVAYLLLVGPHTETAERVLDADDDWYAPTLWRSELRSTLAGYLRNGYIDLEHAKFVAAQAEDIMCGSEILVPAAEILDCIDGSDCSAYDCEFVALAKRLEAPLVTVDRKVLAEFPKVAISPADFLERSSD